jgi:hypothetical protein
VRDKDWLQHKFDLSKGAKHRVVGGHPSEEVLLERLDFHARLSPSPASTSEV